ncbi:MAG: DNA-binding protein [Nanopusillaceae archaeon]|jgi:DNA-binding TFAR19-related protein (PDSD5 family)
MEVKRKLENQIDQIYEIIKPYLTREALDRLTNIKLVYPDKFAQAVLIIYQNIQTGKIRIVDERLLKNILERLSENEKRETKIKFIHR